MDEVEEDDDDEYSGLSEEKQNKIDKKALRKLHYSDCGITRKCESCSFQMKKTTLRRKLKNYQKGHRKNYSYNKTTLPYIPIYKYKHLIKF